MVAEIQRFNPQDVVNQFTITFDQKGEQLVTTWYITKTHGKHIVKKAGLGTVIGATVGAIMGVAVCAIGGKGGEKIIARSIELGTGVGLVGGGVYGYVCAQREIEKLRKVQDITDNVSNEDVKNMCRALFENIFEDAEDIMCPIDHEVMITPMRISACGHVYEATAIANWAAKKDTCPKCRRRFTIQDLRFCRNTFRKVNEAIKHAFKLLAGATKINPHDPEVIKEALNEKNALIIDSKTIDKIKRGKISSLETIAIYRYLRPSIEIYNSIISQTYEENVQRLAELLSDNVISRDEYRVEHKNLDVFYDSYLIKE